MKNQTSKLNETVQKIFRANIETAVLSVDGPPHEPIIKVIIVLPDNRTYNGIGTNKRLAKEQAAKKALKDLGYNYI